MPEHPLYLYLTDNRSDRAVANITISWERFKRQHGQRPMGIKKYRFAPYGESTAVFEYFGLYSRAVRALKQSSAAKNYHAFEVLP
jgi:hypothetical protein